MSVRTISCASKTPTGAKPDRRYAVRSALVLRPLELPADPGGEVDAEETLGKALDKDEDHCSKDADQQGDGDDGDDNVIEMV